MTTTSEPDLAPLSTQPAAPPVPVGGPRRSPFAVVRDGWRQLTSMRTALLLLFLLAVGAVPGSLLPQRGLNPLKVTDFYLAHPSLAPVLDRLYLFDVFAAPWYGAIYLLLFVSLAGCLGPRLLLHAAALRARPPRAPRRLERLPSVDTWDSRQEPAAVAAAAARRLRALHFRVDVREEPDGAVSVAAEKGYLRETGNLLFHVSLLVLLVGVALGGLYGYKGSVLVKEGNGFANTLTSYDNFQPGRLSGVEHLTPFSFTLERFNATYQPNGAPRTFDAALRYRTRPGAPLRSYDLRVNAPLGLDGASLYLLGHGYAPRVVVRGADGRVALDGSVPFLPQNGNFTSSGAIVVPDARPSQLGFSGFLTPTTVRTGRGLESAFPALRKPRLTLLAYRGDTGLDSGVPRSVYSLDTSRMERIKARALAPGQTWQLPGGGSITFTGVDEWATFQVSHDPGNRVALAAGVLMVVGLILSLRIRRRRLWVRVRPTGAGTGSGRSVVEVGGLARTDADAFAEEFTDITRGLRPVPDHVEV